MASVKCVCGNVMLMQCSDACLLTWVCVCVMYVYLTTDFSDPTHSLYIHVPTYRRIKRNCLPIFCNLIPDTCRAGGGRDWVFGVSAPPHPPPPPPHDCYLIRIQKIERFYLRSDISYHLWWEKWTRSPSLCMLLTTTLSAPMPVVIPVSTSVTFFYFIFVCICLCASLYV